MNSSCCLTRNKEKSDNINLGLRRDKIYCHLIPGSWKAWEWIIISHSYLQNEVRNKCLRSEHWAATMLSIFCWGITTEVDEKSCGKSHPQIFSTLWIHFQQTDFQNYATAGIRVQSIWIQISALWSFTFQYIGSRAWDFERKKKKEVCSDRGHGIEIRGHERDTKRKGVGRNYHEGAVE